MSNCQGLSLHPRPPLRGRQRARRDRASIAWTTPTATASSMTTELIRGSRRRHGRARPARDRARARTAGSTTTTATTPTCKPPIDPASPVNIAYEGELLPHYNDSRGHAAGIMAPGGEIYRSDDDGQDLEARRRRLPQPVRLRLQSRRRALHVRQRHGVGRRPALVSPRPRQSLPARRRVRLAQRLGQVAGVLLRQPARASSTWAGAARRA